MNAGTLSAIRRACCASTQTHDYEALFELVASIESQNDAVQSTQKLLDRFGTTLNVFRASEPEIRAVEGVCKEVRTALKAAHTIHVRFLWSQIRKSSNTHSTGLIANWAREVFYHERVDVLLLAVHSYGDFCGIIPCSAAAKGEIGVIPREVLKSAIELDGTEIMPVILRKHGQFELSDLESDVILSLKTPAKHVGVSIDRTVLIVKNGAEKVISTRWLTRPALTRQS